MFDYKGRFGAGGGGVADWTRRREGGRGGGVRGRTVLQKGAAREREERREKVLYSYGERIRATPLHRYTEHLREGVGRGKEVVGKGRKEGRRGVDVASESGNRWRRGTMGLMEGSVMSR